MIQSMTGFATKTFMLTTERGRKSNVAMSIKSLNSRFFELTCRLPQSLLHLETVFLSLFKEKMRRGHVYFAINLGNQDVFQGAIEPAKNSINAYIQALQTIKETYHIESPISLDNILRLPNIFSIEDQSIDPQSQETIFENIRLLIQQVVDARDKEGCTLQKDIMDRITVIQKEIITIEEQATVVVAACKTKVMDTLKEIGADAIALAEAHKHALYTLLEKIDIHEEIIRFKSHLANLRTTLESAEIEKGERIDFILQELTRETNTINAKCADSLIGSSAINIKVEIKKIREQIQNIV